MPKKEEACLICGKPLIYLKTADEMTCAICGKPFLSYAKCEEGHFVCDTCHSEKGVSAVLAYCRQSRSKNPVEIVQSLMAHPSVHMHGPEHHVLVGASLITAYYNAGGKVDLESALTEMKERGGKYPGGSCGFWGCCGAAVSVGMFISIITKATPLTDITWGMANKATSEALGEIADLGGPRCCKRNSFTAIKAAVNFVKANMGIAMELPEKTECSYFMKNKQCKHKGCPYYTGV